LPPVNETFADASSDSSRPKLRVGEMHGWAYAFEHLTTRSADPQILCRLSVIDGEAFSQVYTQTISSFLYEAGGELVSGFDLTVPEVRYGRDAHRLDKGMEQAGFLRPGVPDPPAMGALFLQLTFAIRIDQPMLEGALPRVDLAYAVRLFFPYCRSWQKARDVEQATSTRQRVDTLLALLIQDLTLGAQWIA